MGKCFLALVVAALAIWPPAAAPAAEFSAVVVARIGDQERQSKIFVKGDQIRREYPSPEGSIIFIVPADKEIMWMLDTLLKTYTETPFNREPLSQKLKLTKDGGGKLVGAEKLNGYLADKYETSVKTPGGNKPGTIWMARKLEIPIRIESADKSFSQEYRDIKEGGVDDALFQMPAGYRKKGDKPTGPQIKVVD